MSTDDVNSLQKIRMLGDCARHGNDNVKEKNFFRKKFVSKKRNFIREKVPILRWIRNYTTEWAISDFIAGVTLGLTIIPESIACALLAGLPSNYGLCSALIGPFIYLFFGSIDKVIIGPTSLVALVSVQFTYGKPLEFAFLLTFFSGIVQLIMGFCKFGFIFEFISMPVIKAFSTATAVLVIESQVKVYFGIKYVAPNIISSVETFASMFPSASYGDLYMGIFATVFLIVLERIGEFSKNFSEKTITSVIMRYISFARNTLIVMITGIVSCVWYSKTPNLPFALSKNAMTGLPNVSIPSMYIETSDHHQYTFWDIIKELNIGILVIPVVGILTNLSIGKLDSKGVVNTNQELFTVGLCNVLGSFVQSMPTSGAFTRYAISAGCNLRTPMANLYLSIIVLLALSFLSQYFRYIPEATLAAILVCSIYTLLDFKLPWKLWSESKRDLFIWIICFCCAVLKGVEIGLIISVLINALYLLYLWARPKVSIKIKEIEEMQFICVTPGNAIYFPALSYVRGKILKACEQADFRIPVVIDCQKITGIDYTAAIGISRIAYDICKTDEPLNNCILILYRMDPNHQKLMCPTSNTVFCESTEKLHEILTQESLKSGFINLKDHIRASIDLGYKIEMAE